MVEFYGYPPNPGVGVFVYSPGSAAVSDTSVVGFALHVVALTRLARRLQRMSDPGQDV
jgi:hypothetical protein